MSDDGLSAGILTVPDKGKGRDRDSLSLPSDDATPTEPNTDVALYLAALVAGQEPEPPDTLPDSPILFSLIQACQEAGRLGGDKGGERLGRALAQAWAPVGIADLARRAISTSGRDADRLWRPVLDAARLTGQGTPLTVNVPVQVNLYPGGVEQKEREHRERVQARRGRPT